MSEGGPEGLPSRLGRPLHTFAQSGYLQREADDAHKVVQGHERAQNSTDPQGLALASLNQLERRGIMTWGFFARFRPFLHPPGTGRWEQNH